MENSLNRACHPDLSVGAAFSQCRRAFYCLGQSGTRTHHMGGSLNEDPC